MPCSGPLSKGNANQLTTEELQEELQQRGINEEALLLASHESIAFIPGTIVAVRHLPSHFTAKQSSDMLQFQFGRILLFGKVIGETTALVMFKTHQEADEVVARPANGNVVFQKIESSEEQAYHRKLALNRLCRGGRKSMYHIKLLQWLLELLAIEAYQTGSVKETDLAKHSKCNVCGEEFISRG